MSRIMFKMRNVNFLLDYKSLCEKKYICKDCNIKVRRKLKEKFPKIPKNAFS